jgi:ribosomal protein S6
LALTFERPFATMISTMTGDNKSQNDQISDQDTKLYEIGYLLVPAVSAEELEQTVAQNLILPIEATGGSASVGWPPAMRKLAYPIKITEGGKGTVYREAYFGTIRFRLEPKSVPTINTGLTDNKIIIRHIILSLPDNYDNLISKRSRGVTRKSTRPETDKEKIDEEIESLLNAAV